MYKQTNKFFDHLTELLNSYDIKWNDVFENVKQKDNPLTVGTVFRGAVMSVAEKVAPSCRPECISTYVLDTGDNYRGVIEFKVDENGKTSKDFETVKKALMSDKHLRIKDITN